MPDEPEPNKDELLLVVDLLVVVLLPVEVVVLLVVVLLVVVLVLLLPTEPDAPTEPEAPVLPEAPVEPEVPVVLLAVHLAVSVMSQVTDVANSYVAPLKYQPAKVYPLLVGSVGLGTALPFFMVALETALPPAESKVTVTGALLAYTTEYVENCFV